MDKKEFKKIVTQILMSYGFRKQGSDFRLSYGKNITCVMGLQHSNYGAYYYINCGMFLEDHHREKTPKVESCEISLSRVRFNYKDRVEIDGPKYTDALYYDYISFDELKTTLDNYYNSFVQPAVERGFPYILENLVQWENGKRIGGIYDANLYWIQRNNPD